MTFYAILPADMLGRFAFDDLDRKAIDELARRAREGDLEAARETKALARRLADRAELRAAGIRALAELVGLEDPDLEAALEHSDLSSRSLRDSLAIAEEHDVR